MDRTSPVTRDLRIAQLVSLAIAGVMTVASVAGLTFGGTRLYGDQGALLPAFLGQDLLNLLVGLPLLLGGMWLARRGALLGLLLWPGALFYILYDYAFYVLGAPVNAFFIAYLLMLPACAYTLAAILASVDGHVVRERLARTVPARTTGAVLIGLAALFAALWSFMIVSTVAGDTAPDPIGRVVWTLDLTIQLPALFVGGLLLWRRHETGYVIGFGLLLQAAAYLLGLSAICVLGVDPTGKPVTVASWAPGLFVGAIALVLMAFFVRAATLTGTARGAEGSSVSARAAQGPVV